MGTTFGIKFYYKRSGVGVSLFPWINKVPANHIPLIVERKHPICVETHTPTSAASSNDGILSLDLIHSVSEIDRVTEHRQ